MSAKACETDLNKGFFFDKLFRFFILTGLLFLYDSKLSKWYSLPEGLQFFFIVTILLEFLYSLYHTWTRLPEKKSKHGVELLFNAVFAKESKTHINMSYIRVTLLFFSSWAIFSLENLDNIG